MTFLSLSLSLLTHLSQNGNSSSNQEQKCQLILRSLICLSYLSLVITLSHTFKVSYLSILFIFLSFLFNTKVSYLSILSVSSNYTQQHLKQPRTKIDQVYLTSFNALNFCFFALTFLNTSSNEERRSMRFTLPPTSFNTLKIANSWRAVNVWEPERTHSQKSAQKKEKKLKVARNRETRMCEPERTHSRKSAPSNSS